ncbi:MAG: phage holin family protein [Enterovibrio sp.]
MIIVNAIICTLIVARLLLFVQTGRYQALLAYLVTLAAGIEVILTFYNAVTVNCAEVVLKSVLAIFLFRAQGDIEHLCRRVHAIKNKNGIIL